MKNQEFKIDTKAGVVVFCQRAHGRVFTSKAKACDPSEFNIGIGQLIAMKRNEIEIRKADILTMKEVIVDCELKLKGATGTARKLWTNFIQFTNDKISMSQNHIQELRRDLESLYNKTYVVKPYAEILEYHKIMRRGTEEEKETLRNRPYAVPAEIMDGTHFFEIVNGSATLSASLREV